MIFFNFSMDMSSPLEMVFGVDGFRVGVDLMRSGPN
jgi:hypothetical protein